MKRLLTVLVAVGLLVAGATAYLRHRAAVQRAHDRQVALTTGLRFLADWPTTRYADMTSLTAGGEESGASYENLVSRLQLTSLVVTPGTLSADSHHLPFHVHTVVKALGPLDWDTEIELDRGRVLFHPQAVYPGLSRGQRLVRSKPLLSRGELVDRTGRPIRAASADLAANVLGRPGKTGLERVYDAQLTGSSGGRVEVLDQVSGARTLVKEFPPTPAKPVRTTLDLPTQAAAERALAGVGVPAALVAVDTSTGEIRAAADQPVAGLPSAFRSYAPGSVFKIVTAAAALTHGYTPETVVPCPATAVDGGKKFGNDEALPTSMTLATAFARSCNTAFLDIAEHLPKGTLRQTAPLFGFGRDPLLPTGAQGGDIPVPAGSAEGFADAIGQGRVEASPLLVASMAAAVASGTWRQPHLVTGTAPSVPLPAGVAASLRLLMQQVVTRGTAAGAGLPPGTAGKTGTAQFGTGTPLPTHAWFAGYRGSLAFCVYVETGVSGGRTAAPLAARFLRALG